MSASRDGGHGYRILAEIDWWYREYQGSACPQSHIARELDLDLAQLRHALEALVRQGIIEWRPSGIAGMPDVRRVTPAYFRSKGASTYKLKIRFRL